MCFCAHVDCCLRVPGCLCVNIANPLAVIEPLEDKIVLRVVAMN